MKSGPRMLLLLIDSDGERAASVEAHLRHLGVAVHMTRCDHPTALGGDSPRFDLCVQALDGLHSLSGAGLPVLRDAGQDCPVLALGQPAFDCSLGAILAHGFADWVGTDDPLHLRESARRELATVQARRQTSALRAALLDSERRVEQIMHNTRDAHAVVIDGVHANANNPYLRLLALDPERATATPFLDCVVAAEQGALKAVLRQFARGEASEHRQRIRFSTHEGTTLAVDAHFSPWVGDGERGVLVSLHPDTAGAARPIAPVERDAPSPAIPSTAKHQPAPPQDRAEDVAAADAAPADAAAADAAPADATAADAAAADADEAAVADATTDDVEAAVATGAARPPRVGALPMNSAHTAGGLAAEISLEDTPPDTAPKPVAGHVAEAEAETPTVTRTVAQLRKQLRHAIRQNVLTISLTPLDTLGAQSEEVAARVEPGTLIAGIDDDVALRRLASHVGLASALDRWQLFVASRQAVQYLHAGVPDSANPLRLHVSLCDDALTDDTLPNWLQQLAGQYPQLRHTLWLPLSAARRSTDATRAFRDQLSEIGMRLCLSNAFQHAGDLPDLRALAPHDVCLHNGVLDAWSDGKFSAENVQRLTTLLRSQGINPFCMQADDQLDTRTAARLGFCLVCPVAEEETTESGG